MTNENKIAIEVVKNHLKDIRQAVELNLNNKQFNIGVSNILYSILIELGCKDFNDIK